MNLILRLFGFASLLFAVTVQAALRQYQAPIEQSDWQVESNKQLQCRLSHTIPRLGEVHFVSAASKQLNIDFELDMLSLPATYEQAKIVSMPQAWHAGQGSEPISSLDFKKQFDPSAGITIAWHILAELEKGRIPTIYYHDWRNPNDHISVGISSVNFHNAYDEFLKCKDSLLRFSFSDIAYTVLNYQSNSDEFTKESKRRLKMITEYLKNDTEIELVLVTAYSDSYGGRWPNLKLSERRADALKSFFVENGVDAERIKAEGFGEKRHVASNATILGRETNRRVVIRMNKP